MRSICQAVIGGEFSILYQKTSFSTKKVSSELIPEFNFSEP